MSGAWTPSLANCYTEGLLGGDVAALARRVLGEGVDARAQRIRLPLVRHACRHAVLQLGNRHQQLEAAALGRLKLRAAVLALLSVGQEVRLLHDGAGGRGRRNHDPHAVVVGRHVDRALLETPRGAARRRGAAPQPRRGHEGPGRAQGARRQGGLAVSTRDEGDLRPRPGHGEGGEQKSDNGPEHLRVRAGRRQQRTKRRQGGRGGCGHSAGRGWCGGNMVRARVRATGERGDSCARAGTI